MAQLDDQILAFIQRTNEFYPDDAVDGSVAQQRLWYDELCAQFRQPRPDGLLVNDAIIESNDGYQVPIRTYRHAAMLSVEQVLFAHGGGFVVGGLESHDDVCAEIAHRCQVDVVAVDYRLAPEYQYPKDVEDCLAVLDSLLDKGHQVVLVGDSAGGTLSACVANQRLAECNSRILGQVLIYPSLVIGEETPSMIEHAEAPMLTRKDMDYYLPIRTAGAPSPVTDSGFVAMACEDFSQLPETHLFPAQVDPLCDDCAIYAEALSQAGVAVTNHLELGRGLVHGHLRARNMSDKARRCFDGICQSISQVLEK
jgi:acetyl esterase